MTLMTMMTVMTVMTVMTEDLGDHHEGSYDECDHDYDDDW